MSKKVKVTEVKNANNDAQEIIGFSNPFTVKVKIRGTSDFLFHRWSNEAVAEKAASAKASKAKKTDDVESFVYRNDDGELCIPGEYLRAACIHAAKYKQDPRSPRKSAMDLTKAGLISITTLASLGKEDWDYLDQRRVVIQRSAITRSRPAIKEGWECEFLLTSLLPEYIDQKFLMEILSNAGKLVGIGDFRPTFGRFQVTNFENITI